MNNEIRESINRLGQIKAADLGDIDHELATLETLLRKEIETQTGVVNAAESRDPAYSTAASGLVAMLQLAQAATDSRKELDKLVFAAGKAVARVTKKAPK